MSKVMDAKGSDSSTALRGLDPVVPGGVRYGPPILVEQQPLGARRIDGQKGLKRALQTSPEAHDTNSGSGFWLPK